MMSELPNPEDLTDEQREALKRAFSAVSEGFKDKFDESWKGVLILGTCQVEMTEDELKAADRILKEVFYSPDNPKNQ